MQDSRVATNGVVRLSIDAEKMLPSPLAVKTVKYFGRPGLKDLFEKLIDDQTGKRLFNISLIVPPDIGKSDLVFAAAEHIAYTKKKSVLWVGCRVEREEREVKLFSASDKAAGDLSQLIVSTSLDEKLSMDAR